MKESKQLSQEVISDFYRRDKKKQKVCWSLIIIGMSIWFVDIYIGLDESAEIIVFIGQILVAVSIVCSFVTDCPACKRYNFRMPTCSVCKFPLIRKRK